MKRPPKTRTKIMPSDMPPSLDARHTRHAPACEGRPVVPLSSRLLQARLDERPALHVGDAVLDALDDDLGPCLDRQSVEAARVTHYVPTAGVVLDGTRRVGSNRSDDAGGRALEQVTLVDHLFLGARDGPLHDERRGPS